MQIVRVQETSQLQMSSIGIESRFFGPHTVRIAKPGFWSLEVPRDDAIALARAILAEAGNDEG